MVVFFDYHTYHIHIFWCHLCSRSSVVWKKHADCLPSTNVWGHHRIVLHPKHSSWFVSRNKAAVYAPVLFKQMQNHICCTLFTFNVHPTQKMARIYRTTIMQTVVHKQDPNIESMLSAPLTATDQHYFAYFCVLLLGGAVCPCGICLCCFDSRWLEDKVGSLVRPTIQFSPFAIWAYFASVFAKHTTKYETLTIHFSYFMQIWCFNNAAKKWTTKSFDFSYECRSWCEMLRNAKSGKRGVKCEKRDAKYPAIYFLFFTFLGRFRVFRDKCRTGLRDYSSSDVTGLHSMFSVLFLLRISISNGYK